MRRSRLWTERGLPRTGLVSKRPTAPAQRPPAGIVGLDPRWSRLVRTPNIDGVGRTWHLLDSWADRDDSLIADLTLLCVHGNPSWSFLWRDLIARVDQASGATVRVIAVDQLEMGFSERTGQKRPLATRVNDLCALSAELELAGPVITVAHDWGGPISLGWALRHLRSEQDNPSADEQSTPPKLAPVLAGIVLTNTAVHQPAGSPAPAVIRLIRSRAMLKASTVYTRAFIHGAIEMSRPRLDPEVRAGFMAPYQNLSRRAAIADFVADIPLDPDHESAITLDEIAAGIARLEHIPTLLLWGPRDKVFSDLYLHDLEKRLPHATVHRFPKAAHFVAEDADVGSAVISWLGTLPEETKSIQTNGSKEESSFTPITKRRALTDFSAANPTTNAIVESGTDQRSITFGELARRVEQLASGMLEFGIRAGDRVAVMVLPGIDLSLVVYGCWRLGATIVLVDSGLGPKGMQQALQSANPVWLIGIDKALVAAKVLRWPGKRISVSARSAVLRRTLSIKTDLQSLIADGAAQPTAPLPEPDVMAAIAFTSGSTGPSKGVMYRHHQIEAQRDALISLYEITPDDRLVAAFAPFALYGPTMCITSMVPDMNVAAPGTLTATALADAVVKLDATLVFASPAALVNVIATRTTLAPRLRSALESVRLVLSAGAPVRAELLETASGIFSQAEFRTPYGMTEMLPVADVSLKQLQQIGKHRVKCTDDAYDIESADTGEGGDGVCVGYPLPGVQLMIDPLDSLGQPTNTLSSTQGVLGEIVVRAAHAREGYDRLWLTQHQASQPVGWHRTGDIGSLDAAGRLWVGGRLGHVITTPAGPVAPVSAEQSIETLDDVSMAAVVGVGPVGRQVIVAVLQSATEKTRPDGATLALIDQVRSKVDATIDIAAVLMTNRLPVDRRHNSKVDRSAVADWAASMLAGDRVRSL